MSRRFRRGQLSLLDDSTFAFVSGTRQTAQLPVPGTFIKRLWLHLRGTLTVSVVTVPGTVHADGPVNLVRNIELLLDGDPVKVGRLAHFFRLAQKYDKTLGVNSGLVGAGAGVYEFEAVIPLLFAMPDSKGAFDTVEDGRSIRNMVLNLTWGTTADLIFGNTSTLALTGTSVAVYLEDTEPFPRVGTPYRFKESDTSYLNIVTSVGSRLQVPFTGGGVIRSLMLKAVDGSDLSDAVINSVVAVNVNGKEEVPFDNIEDDFFQAYAQHLFGLGFQPPEGYYFIEFAERGLVLTTGLGARVPAQSFNSLEVVANTTVGVGATSIVGHLAEVVPNLRQK